MKNAIMTYQSGKPNEYISEVNVKPLPDTEPFQVPIAIWINQDEMRVLKNHLKDCAEKGILVAIAKRLY